MAGASPGLGAGDVVGMADGPLGAYVHIPFCLRICPFCPYNNVVPRGDQPERYFAALHHEVDQYLRAGAGGADGFTSLYVGGGTPTLYPENLAALLDAVPVRGERAIEVLPTHATVTGLGELRAAGFTAVSIGAQSFDDGVLHALRRPHDATQSHDAVRAALGRFDLVDVDLIVDVELDDRRAGAFLRDLEECFRLGVDQVSTYPLMRFGYTPFGASRHDHRREHEVLDRASRIAHAHGYERRSVWTFNRRGSATYTSITRRRFLGWGAGASSFLGRDFLVNHFGVETYIDDVRSERLPVARWLHLGPLAGAAYDAFWQAYAGRVAPGVLQADFGPWAAPVAATARILSGAGLLARVPGPGGDREYALTGRGYDAYHDLERWVTYHLIEPLWAEMLAEHGSEGARGHWSHPGQARRSTVWAGVNRLLAADRPARSGPATASVT